MTCNILCRNGAALENCLRQAVSEILEIPSVQAATARIRKEKFELAQRKSILSRSTAQPIPRFLCRMPVLFAISSKFDGRWERILLSQFLKTSCIESFNLVELFCKFMTFLSWLMGFCKIILHQKG